MSTYTRHALPILLASSCFALTACAESSSSSAGTALALGAEVDSLDCDGPGALSRCQGPTRPASYYVDQSEKYFRSLASAEPPWVYPNYGDEVIRWEWAPWLYLTGKGAFTMWWTGVAQKLYPTTFKKMDCRAFDVQPFGRCHVDFDYAGQSCPIYEEFTFNARGEMTFIEAWTDAPGYLPMDPETDFWAEGADVTRLSTRVPGLGTARGDFDLKLAALHEAAASDPDLQNLIDRASRPFITWLAELWSHRGKSLLDGCHPE